MKKLKNVLAGAAVALLVSASLTPDASAAMSYGTLSVSQNGQTAGYGYGNIDVAFLTATNTAYVRAVAYNGRGVYSKGRANNSGQTLNLRSYNTTSTSYQNVSKGRGYGAPTAGPWWGSAQICVDVAYALDPCGSKKTGTV